MIVERKHFDFLLYEIDESHLNAASGYADDKSLGQFGVSGSLMVTSLNHVLLIC